MTEMMKVFRDNVDGGQLKSSRAQKFCIPDYILKSLL